MTFSLAIKNGDLQVTGSACAIVYGQTKLQQDMTIWLLTRYGSTRMHPTFGSALQSYIGGIIGPTTQANCYNEILRTLTNYQNMVYQLFSANPSQYSLGEIPYSIDSINVALSYDTVYATIQVSNPQNTTTVTISPTSL
jgi:phage baseplate assembly protein W